MLLAQAVRSAALEGTLQQLIDDLPQAIALLDEAFSILAVNRAWRELGQRRRYHVDALPGDDYRALCAGRAAEGHQPAVEAGTALDDIAAGKTDFWQLIFNGGERWDNHNFQICFRRIAYEDKIRILVTRFDLTELAELRRDREELGNLLVAGQDLERQRLARELHDSTSQSLTCMGLLLGRLENLVSNDASHLVHELQELVRETSAEIRSISHLALPPSLDKLGFTEAMNALVGGFARRSGLEASFEAQGALVSFPDAVAFTFYRIAQEALSNVLRHSQASRVRVLLCFRRSAIHLVVADNGVGISAETLAGSGSAGVGFASMRLRLCDVGGRLSVLRPSPGTALIASVPAPPA